MADSHINPENDRAYIEDLLSRLRGTIEEPISSVEEMADEHAELQADDFPSEEICEDTIAVSTVVEEGPLQALATEETCSSISLEEETVLDIRPDECRGRRK